MSNQVLEIPVLGRQFKLGSLYNARTDEIIPGNENDTNSLLDLN